MANVKIFVDACVLSHPKGVGVGIVCPQYPSLNAGESVPRSLGDDINIAELYAIIRAMEKAAQNGIPRLTIVSDNTNAVAVARQSINFWPKHFDVGTLKQRFQQAKQKLQRVEIEQLPYGGDSHHNTADQLAKNGARNW